MAVHLYSTLASASSARQILGRLRQEEARASRAEALRAQAGLRALRAQLNPHFLFNTLHSLMALVRTDPEGAEEGMEQFGGLLRYSLSIHRDSTEEVPLRREWAFVGDYLALESLRLGERLKVHLEVPDEALDCLVPALCRSHIVNLDQVAAMEPHDDRRLVLRLRDGSRVVASRSGSRRLRELIC